MLIKKYSIKKSARNCIYLYREIYNISKCFNKSHRVTCARASNRKYIIKRKRVKYKLLLHECSHNYLNIMEIKEYYYLIVIIVEPRMFYERVIFRSIYKKYLDIVFVFCMGVSNRKRINKKIEKEIKKYNDIIQFNFSASYYSLILQTYNILLWCSKLKIRYKWLIKHDSDTFFNVKILEYIQNNNNNHTIEKSIWGYILNEYNLSFPSGMGYIIPYSRIADIIIASASYVNQDCYGPAEDVFIGNLANISNIEMYDIRLSHKIIGEGGCLINNLNDFIMIHRLTPNEIFYLHTQVL